MNKDRKGFQLGIVMTLLLFVGMVPSALAKPMFSGLSSSGPINGQVGTGATVKANTVFVGPGEFEEKLPIEVINQTGATFSGLQFKLDLSDVDHSTLGDPVLVLDQFLINSGFRIDTNWLENDTLIVVIWSESGGSVAPGDFIAAWLCFEANNFGPVFKPNTPQDHNPFNPLGTQDLVDVVEGSVVVSGFFGELIGNGSEDGYIQIGIRCDTNLDGLITVQDVVVWVNSAIFFGFPFEGPDDVGFKIFDGNQDNAQNIADAIAIVNKILGLPIGDGVPVKALAGGPVRANLGGAELQSNGQLAIPVMLDAAGVIAGAEATFTFDPSALTVGTPYLVGDATHMLINSKVENGKLRVVVVSLVNQGLATGAAPMMMIPVTPLGDGEAILTLDTMTLAGRQAQVVAVQVGSGTQPITKGMLAPKAFALNGNAPNPFNPSTTISYEVPQQAHITLTVYNLLGQEVIRLVDQSQAAGRYTVVWNARNRQGLQVASGVYLYRITSSTGFSDVKRMTLLK